MKKAIEYLLFNSEFSNYQISKATGLSQVLLSKYANEKSDIGRMQLNNAIKLYNYFQDVVLVMLEKKYGKVSFEGKEYILTENAYLKDISMSLGDGVRLTGDFYVADAIDREGNEFVVYWEPEDGWLENEDASYDCDWANPKYVIPL